MLFMQPYNCIVVLGPTASGKTNLACGLANSINGAIISADSRQVYKQLDIGTGKDLNEYLIDKKEIKHYGINICDVNEQFYLHNFCKLLFNSFYEITTANKTPIICGGTGLYLDALHKDFSLTQVPEDYDLRNTLDVKTNEELIKILHTFDNESIKHVDLTSKKRIIRGIEVASYIKASPNSIIKASKNALPYKPIYFGIKPEQKVLEDKINKRLQYRLNNGLIEEAEFLLKHGVTHIRLQQLGLEYKFLSFYLLNLINRKQLQEQLLNAILKFSKRQLTWFKKMEKEGIEINWNLSENEILHKLNYGKQL